VKQLHGKNVLELGCGVGLTGISVITICHPQQYIFSDYNPAVLELLCENIKLNFLEENKQCNLLNTFHTDSKLRLQLKFKQSDVRVIELNWEDIDEHTTNDLSQPDIIIGSDILYNSDSFDSLILGLKHLLTSNNYAVFAATVRNENTIAQFLKQLGISIITYIIYENQNFIGKKIDTCAKKQKYFISISENQGLAFEEYTMPKQIIRIELIDVPVKVLKIFQKI